MEQLPRRRLHRMTGRNYQIAVLQSCDESYVPLLLATAATNAAYAYRCGYSYRHVIGNLSPVPHTANFNRYYLLKQEIDRGINDWAFWIDADAIVINHDIRLESIIERSPEKLLIACRGAPQGDHDINNGVFLLNLRHPLARDLTRQAIQYCEQLPETNKSFQDDQQFVHQWLLARRNKHGRVPIVQCYSGPEYNLFNYDGGFIRHVLREYGSFHERASHLRRLAMCVHSDRAASAEQLNPGGHHRSMVIGSECDPQDRSGSFQQQQGILVVSLAAHACPPPSSQWLVQSCLHHGIELTLIGADQPFSNDLRKIAVVADYLRAQPQYSYVLMVDFKDVIFCAGLRELFFKYLSCGHQIVASAQRKRPALHVQQWPQTSTSFRFLNSGSIFATRDAWLAAWEWMQDRQPTFNSDLAAWTDLYIHGDADIALDATCSMFQVLEGLDNTLGMANGDLLLEGHRVRNRETGDRPCLLHSAGNVPWSAWAEYVLDPSPAWIWPLIERIREALPQVLCDVGSLQQLLLELGLHELPETMPFGCSAQDELLQHSGKGLAARSYPNQFAPYLIWLAAQPPIRSYLQIGVQEGGSFITTVEYLRRFHPLRSAIGIDPQVTPAMRDYCLRTDGCQFIRCTEGSSQLRRLLTQVGPVDLTLIDDGKAEDRLRLGWALARRYSRYVALHQIAAEPAMQSLWDEIRATYRLTCQFAAQYPGPAVLGGLGVVDLRGEMC